MTTHMTSKTEDISAILAVVAAMEQFQSDVDGFTGLLTEDVVLVNAVGRRVFGREAMRAAMAAALQTPLANVFSRNEVADVRFLRQDVAVVSGIKRLREEGGGSAAPGSKAIFSLVLVHEGEAWRIAVAHNTLAQE
jgi:uncharacterized protein (TIGR02246 family)